MKYLTRTALTAALLLASAVAAAGPLTNPGPRVECVDASGNTVLVADGRKVRVAFWKADRPYFTKGNRAAAHRDAFPAPEGSSCYVGRAPRK